MRGILAASVALAFIAGCGPSDQRAANSYPAFELRGIRPGMTVAGAGAIITNCTTPDGFQVCWFADKTLAGMPLKRGFLEFGPKGFQALEAHWDPHDYGVVLAELRQAYGEPCRIDPAPAPSALQPDMMSEAAVWCFATGEAVLKQYDHSLSDSSFKYADRNAVPFPVSLPATTPGSL